MEVKSIFLFLKLSSYLFKNLAMYCDTETKNCPLQILRKKIKKASLVGYHKKKHRILLDYKITEENFKRYE